MEHQAINQPGFAWCGRQGAERLQLLTGVSEVPGHVEGAAWGHGDQRVERHAPGIQRVRDEGDLLDGELRVVVHGGGPQAATCSTESFMPSWVAMV